MTVSLRGASPGVSADSPAAIRAPLFHDLVTGLDATHRHVALDLGAASSAMLALLGRSRSRVEISDLVHSSYLDPLNAMEPGPALDAATDALLPKRSSDEAVDLVFCWDLPNYLSLPALSALMKGIARRCCGGAQMHALIFYADRDMNTRPGRLIPTVNGELLDRGTTNDTIAAPRYSPDELGRSTGEFVIDRARLLSNGMQEFLFRLER